MKKNQHSGRTQERNGLTRRDFLKRGVTFISLSLASNYMMMQTGPSYDSVFGQASQLSGSNKLLVLVQLRGGNDGLNTLVPFKDGSYFDQRPNLAVPAEQVLPVDEQLGLGLHPNLVNLKKFFDQGKLAIVPGAGYPDPNRSHFRSTDIWMSAQPEKVVGTGWIGRYLDESIAKFHGISFPAANVKGTLPLTLRGNQVVVPSIQSIESYQFQTDPRYPQDRDGQLAVFQAIHGQMAPPDSYLSFLLKSGLSAVESASELQQAAAAYTSSVQYPQDPFGQALKLLSEIITGGLGTQVMHVALGGFDTHASQNTARTNQPLLLATLDAGLAALHQDLVEHEIADEVVIMTFSEFGRRVRENGSGGTDHGTAAPMFILGDAVKGGLHSEQPSLTKLDKNGDLIFTTDFRQIYATILENWLEADSTGILGGSFSKLGFLG